MQLNKFLNSSNYKLPYYPLIYSPQSFCKFSLQGETMVKELLEISPFFHETFNKIVDPDDQKRIATESFNKMKALFLEREAKRLSLETTVANNNNNLNFRKEMLAKAAKEDGLSPSGGKPFYLTKRSYSLLTPAKYKRTEAPRISATGNTLHGMKKDLSGKILKEIIREMREDDLEYSIMDLDMSAAHARFAVALQGSRKSELFNAVEYSGKFWDEKASYFHELISKAEIPLDKKQVRAMLKVALYTSLNGGNPFSEARMYKNLTDQNQSITLPFSSSSEFVKSDLYLDMKSILSQFSLISEVQELNKKCVVPDHLITCTLDRVDPYVFDSQHKGISRALQGFEIILLCVLVQAIVKRNGLPINLAHDGAMILMKGNVDDKQLVLDLQNDIKNWAHYLLDGLSLPIECKFNINTANVDAI